MIVTEKIKFKELNDAIENSGLKRKYICEQLDLSQQALRLKLYGISPFTAKDIKILKEVLNLSADDVVNLFLL